MPRRRRLVQLPSAGGSRQAAGSARTATAPPAAAAADARTPGLPTHAAGRRAHLHPSHAAGRATMRRSGHNVKHWGRGRPERRGGIVTDYCSLRNRAAAALSGAMVCCKACRVHRTLWRGDGEGSKGPLDVSVVVATFQPGKRCKYSHIRQGEMRVYAVIFFIFPILHLIKSLWIQASLLRKIIKLDPNIFSFGNFSPSSVASKHSSFRHNIAQTKAPLTTPTRT